ncbi:MAG: hypothetical protein V4805_12095 [Pseudomonadota bacterium]
MNFLPSIADVPHLWSQDGSLRDVYFVNTTLAHWERFLAFVRNSTNQYSFDGEEADLPPIEEIFANREGRHILTVATSGVAIACHFFIPEEIELDIDPREIHGEDQHEAVLEFLASLSLAIGRPALLTPENGLDLPFLSFEPNLHTWTVHG